MRRLKFINLIVILVNISLIVFFFSFFFCQNMSNFLNIEINKIAKILSKLSTTCMIKVLKIFLLSFFNITKFG
jgi:riboflavin transporter FmnP